MAEKKKFCPDCGKALEEGKKHVCGQGGSNDILDKAKGYLNDFLSMVKKPATTLEKKAKEGTIVDALIVLGILALSAGLFMLIALKPILTMTIKATTGFTITDFSSFKLPYFKTFIITVLVTFLFAFIPVLVTFIAGKIAKKEKLNFTRCSVMYAYTMSPVIFLYLINAIIFLTQVSFLITISLIATAFIEFVLLVNYFKLVADDLEVKDDLRGHAITGIMFAWVAIVVVIMMIFGKTIYGDMSISPSSSSKASSSSIFKF